MSSWDDILTERDKAVFAASGYGRRMGFGKRPALLIVDVNYNFAGDKPEPVLESIKKWRNSCGEEAWAAIDQTRKLLAAARAKRIPVIYTTAPEARKDGWDSGRWADKNSRRNEDRIDHGVEGNAIVAEIAPWPEDIVVRKMKPSPFFGTLLAGYLVDLQVDSVIVCGATTSGCVRATVIDAFSYNYRVSIVEECTFDRGQASHKINLFDMNEKYADVVSIAETIEYLNRLQPGLFDDNMPALKAKD